MQYSMGMEVQHARDNLVQEVSCCQNKTRCCTLRFEILALKMKLNFKPAICLASIFSYKAV